ncbi:MAG: CvpA family protein [Verrucomicrobiales bacterium]|nr:CvpA family protein [Verrucomicrobiales bacterium]MCP5559375.1 CvpA family protein [Verrucomicrobiaceae bacterium]
MAAIPSPGPIFDTLDKIPLGTWVTAGAAGVVAFLAGLAFSRGIVKQLMSVVSLTVGVGAAWYVFSHRVQVFGAAGSSMPMDRLMMFSGIAGVICFFITKAGMHILAAFGLLRIFAGMTGWRGMLASAVPSGFMLWMASMVLRVVGNLYGMETASAVAKEGSKLKNEAVSLWQKVSQQLDRSPLGNIANQVDPFDMRSTSNLARLLILWPDGRVWASLAKDAKTREVLNHPRIQQLGHDPAVRKCIASKDFAALLQLPQVSDAASHPDLEPVLSGLALEDAMDAIIYNKGRAAGAPAKAPAPKVAARH